MITQTLEQVRRLPDSQVVSVLEALIDEVFDEVDFGTVRDHASGDVELERLLSLDGATLEQPLSRDQSTSIGRAVLESYASDPALSELVARACKTVDESDDMVIGTIVALGIVINLTLLVATTEVKVKKGKDGKVQWSLVKRKASPELVERVVKPLAKVAVGDS